MRRLPSSPPAERSQGKESGPTGQPTHLIVRVHVISQTKYQLRKVPFATSRGRKEEDGGLRRKYRNKRTKLRMSNISQILPRCTFYLFIGIYLIYSCSYLLSTAIKRPSIQCDSRGTFHSVAPWTKVKAVMRETMSTPIHFRTASRAMNYELKAANSPCQALRECIKYNRTEVTPTASARRLYLARLGFSEGVLEEMRARGVDTLGILRQRQEDQWVQTMSLEGEVSPFSLPGYLRRGKDYKMVARFRLGNETRGDQSWRRDRSCRVCDLHEETTRHLLERSGQDPNVVLLHENGRGREAMRRILDWRRAYEEENIVMN